MSLVSRRTLEALLLVVSSMMFLWSAAVVVASSPICSSDGYNNSRIACGGSCPAEGGGSTPCPNPPSGVGSDPVNVNYQFCACPGEGESVCCKLILRDSSHSPRIAVKGFFRDFSG
jgi:hypothetical protein